MAVEDIGLFWWDLVAPRSKDEDIAVAPGKELLSLDVSLLVEICTCVCADFFRCLLPSQNLLTIIILKDIHQAATDRSYSRTYVKLDT